MLHEFKRGKMMKLALLPLWVVVRTPQTKPDERDLGGEEEEEEEEGRLASLSNLTII